MKYDIPVEVTKEQYNYLKVNYAGIVAHKNEDERYWIKLWMMKYKDEIELFLQIENNHA